jgi:hypothetical protein
MTFDVPMTVQTHVIYSWQRCYEAFSVCRNCKRPTIFVIEQSEIEDADFLKMHPPQAFTESLNSHFTIKGFISIKDMGADEPPDHVPEPVSTAFREGAVSVVTGCWNAAGAMFRLAIDLATAPKLPEKDVPGLTGKVRRDLGLRLPWLFDNGYLPGDLRELSSCVREDGNEAAHAGTLTKVEAQDLLDFTTTLLERIFTEPERLRLARERRDKRWAQRED